MFWLQLGTLVLINLVILGMLFIPVPNPQHGHAGGGAYDAWRLIDEIEAEREAEYTGRRLRPAPDADPPTRDRFTEAAYPPQTGSARQPLPDTAPIHPGAWGLGPPRSRFVRVHKAGGNLRLPVQPR
jgi:hypothetical protein